MENIDTISRDHCDTCGTYSHKRQLVVTLHDHGVPVLTMCRRCGPSTFENTAQRDKDRWLETGRLNP